MINTQSQILSEIVQFVKEIGLEIQEKKIESNSFLPGIQIELGQILYDTSKLNHPGDILHEAGHLALMKPNERAVASGDLEPGDGKTMNQNSLEIGVILWTWAVIKDLGIDPRIVFHQEGYKGSSEWYIKQFEARNYIGLPLLIWMSLTDDLDGEVPFPKMKKWLRE